MKFLRRVSLGFQKLKSFPNWGCFLEFCVNISRKNTEELEVIKGLILNGMNVARLNFSKKNHSYHLNFVKHLRKAIEDTGMNCGIMLDTMGPAISTSKPLKPLHYKEGMKVKISIA